MNTPVHWCTRSTGAGRLPPDKVEKKKQDRRLAGIYHSQADSHPNPEALSHKQFFRLNSSCQALCNGFVDMDTLICTATLRSRHD